MSNSDRTATVTVHAVRRDATTRCPRVIDGNEEFFVVEFAQAALTISEKPEVPTSERY